MIRAASIRGLRHLELDPSSFLRHGRTRSSSTLRRAASARRTSTTGPTPTARCGAASCRERTGTRSPASSARWATPSGGSLPATGCARAGPRLRVRQLRAVPRRASALVPQPLDAAGLGLRRCDRRAGPRRRTGAGRPRSRGRLPRRATRLGGARDQAQLVGAAGGRIDGLRVAVVGAGAIGLCAVLAARALGAAEVTVVARHEHQARVASPSARIACSTTTRRRARRSAAYGRSSSSRRRAGTARRSRPPGPPSRTAARSSSSDCPTPAAISTWRDSFSVTCTPSSPPPTGRATAPRLLDRARAPRGDRRRGPADHASLPARRRRRRIRRGGEPRRRISPGRDRGQHLPNV